MPSKSAAQARLMAAVAHDAGFAKEKGIPQQVAREFSKADSASGLLQRAMANRLRGKKKGTPV